MRANTATSRAFVWRSMNARSGSAARSRNCRCVIRPAAYGRSASRSMRSNVGVMITNVNTSASPVSTGFGGNEAAPIADRTSESTTTMRTNDVESTSTNGASESSVNPASTSNGNAE